MNHSSHIAVKSLPRDVELVDTITAITPSGVRAVYDVYVRFDHELGDFFYFLLVDPHIRLIVRSKCGSYRVLGDMAYVAGLR